MFNYEKNEFLFWYIRIKSKISEKILKIEMKIGKKATKFFIALIGALLSSILIVIPILVLQISFSRNIWIITLIFLINWCYISLPFITILKKNRNNTPEYKIKIK